MLRYIFHIAERARWQQAAGSHTYTPEAFAADGFVHCSTRDQLLGVANRYYSARDDLVLLCIEPRRLDSPVCYENLDGRLPLFPHIYGPVDIAAVEHVLDFAPGEDGAFAMPALLSAPGEVA